MARVLVAMSGGVDSSVAAALLREQGHVVIGATMKLWGGDSDTGCCSVSDVDDARRVAQQLDIDHHVFAFSDDFMDKVVDPYVDAHKHGLTPNPCIACNKYVKFDRFYVRARQLGFDYIATGHHARLATNDDGSVSLLRSADPTKDQSYVLHVIEPEVLERLMLPVGSMTKAVVREHAARLGLRTASKPDSQDVCFITAKHGREKFLGDRIPLRPATLVDSTGARVGSVDAVELVTVGQRRGLGMAPDTKYALAVDPIAGEVLVGTLDDLHVTFQRVDDWHWLGDEPAHGSRFIAQCSAHGVERPAIYEADGVRFDEPHRRVAPGQYVVLYEGNRVVGGGTAAAMR